MDSNPHDRIEVIVGVLTGVFREDKAGEMELVPYYMGRPKVFVEIVDTNGDRQGAWEGEDVAEAFRHAHRIGQSFGIPVLDLSAKGECQ